MSEAHAVYTADAHPGSAGGGVNYRCSKGHRWRSPPSSPLPSGDGVLVLPPDPTPFCLRCVLESMRKHIGVVEEDKHDKGSQRK